MTDKERVLELRAKGMSWRAIESAMGWPSANGNRPWRLVQGGDNAGHPRDSERVRVTISLWSHAAGGRSFKKIEALLGANGIHCEKGDVSPWEDRIEVLVAPEDRERAEDLLFRPVGDHTSRVQSLDNLSDHTK